MCHELEVGRRFAAGTLAFYDHRWRRALVAYDQLERVTGTTCATWREGFGEWSRGYRLNRVQRMRLRTCSRKFSQK